MPRKTDTVDISAFSSDELIEHYLVLLMKQAEDMKAGEVDIQHATLLALLHMAQSLDQMEFRVYHMVQALEGIRAIMERKQ